MKKFLKSTLFVSLTCFISISTLINVSAHSGMTDIKGTHNRQTTETYHYYNSDHRATECEYPYSNVANPRHGQHLDRWEH